MFDIALNTSSSLGGWLHVFSTAATIVAAAIAATSTFISGRRIEKLKSDLANEALLRQKIATLLTIILNERSPQDERAAANITLKLIFFNDTRSSLGAIVNMLPVDIESADFGIIIERIWGPASSYLNSNGA